jgi:hypothetical protein
MLAVDDPPNQETGAAGLGSKGPIYRIAEKEQKVPIEMLETPAARRPRLTSESTHPSQRLRPPPLARVALAGRNRFTWERSARPSRHACARGMTPGPAILAIAHTLPDAYAGSGPSPACAAAIPPDPLPDLSAAMPS